MKKERKIKLILLNAILITLSFANSVKAGAGKLYECSYSFQGHSLVVQELDKDKINVIPANKTVGLDGKTYVQELKAKWFYNSKQGEFYCPDIYAVVDDDEILITNTPGKKTAEVIHPNSTDRKQYESICVYSAGDSTITFTAAASNKANVTMSPSKKHFNEISVANFYADGYFKCIDGKEVVLEVCSKGSKRVSYWVLLGDTKDHCDEDAGRDLIPGKKEIIKDVTKSSKWNSSDGNSNAFLKKIWGMLKVIIPALVIIFSIVDFLKVIFTSEEKNYKEAYIKMLKRIAVGIILFLIPALIKVILEVSGLKEIPLYEIFK